VPDEAELSDVYGEGYYTGRDSVGYRNYGKPNTPAALSWLGRLPGRILRVIQNPSRLVRQRPKRERAWPYDLVDLVGAIAPTGRLLDIGCAKGNFLAAARSEGWSVKGVEFSAYSASCARSERNLDVFTGTLADALANGFVRPASFDVVTAWDTVEHVADAMALFRDCAAALKPGGFLFVETLNIDSDRSKAEGQNWHFFRPPKHLFYYGEDTLTAYFHRAGFAIVRDDDFRHDVVTLAGRKAVS
jgi:2-polyprenyl-3-methyl-5-hydroxy-6-metoxy-1,4-benzoquinol methylase